MLGRYEHDAKPQRVVPTPTNNLELFVCERVAAELQPLLDEWRDAVRSELHAIQDVSADATDWREAVSVELSEMRAQQDRSWTSLQATAAKLADVPPSKLQVRIEKQETTLLSSIGRLQSTVGEARQAFERAEASSSKEKQRLVQAINDEKVPM